MWINVNGIRMYYEVHGSGRPLIMVHGNSEEHGIFYDSRVLLSKHFTVYTVDSRGHGHSTRVEEFHYADMADDMIREKDAEDMQKINLPPREGDEWTGYLFWISAASITS